jgi:hypothetical protein
MFTGIVAGVLSLLAYIPRGIKIVREKSHRSNTWLIWTLSNFLIFLSLYTLGARTIIWVPLAYFLGSATMTILAYTHKGSSGWTTLQKWLFTIAMLSAIRWTYFSDPLLTQGFNIVIYFISHVMIIKNKLVSKNRESWVITWALYFGGAILNLLAVNNWALSVSVYPIMVAVMNGLVFMVTLKIYIENIRTRVEPISSDLL